MTDFKIGDRVRAKHAGAYWQNCRVIGEDVIDGMRFVSVKDLDQCATGGFFHENLERLTDAAGSKPVAEQDRFRVGDVVRFKTGVWPDGHWADGKIGEVTEASGNSLIVKVPGSDWLVFCTTREVEREAAAPDEGASAVDLPVLSSHGNGPQLVQPDPSKRPEYVAGAALVKEIDARSRHVNEFWTREQERILGGALSVPLGLSMPLGQAAEEITESLGNAYEKLSRDMSRWAEQAMADAFVPNGADCLKRTKSTHCARCGDPFPLDDRNESACRFRGEWYHHQCATVVAARLEEERKATLARVGPDPYKRVKGKDICAGVDNVRGMTAMQVVGEKQRRAENAALFGRRVPERFTADKVPEAKAVVHPWECDEGEP